MTRVEFFFNVPDKLAKAAELCEKAVAKGRQLTIFTADEAMSHSMQEEDIPVLTEVRTSGQSVAKPIVTSDLIAEIVNQIRPQLKAQLQAEIEAEIEQALIKKLKKELQEEILAELSKESSDIQQAN